MNTDDRNEIEYGFARTLGRTDWDATATLCRRSAEIGDQRPPVTGGAVDWQAVTLDRQWNAAVRGGEKLSADELALIQQTQDSVLARYVAKDARGMLYAWQSAPQRTACLTELAVVAHLYAELGSRQAEPLIAIVRRSLPAEAEALAGILAWRQGKLSESGARLAAAIGRLRSEPWLLEHVRSKAFEAAIGVSKADPSQAAKLLRAFGAPFAACYADESRCATACVIAEGVSPAAVARWVESFEPHVPWSERFLAYRRQAYREAGHRLADQSDRDLREFIRGAAGAPAFER